MADVVGMDGKGVSPIPVHHGIAPDVKRRMVVLYAQFQGLTAVGKTIREEFGLALDNRTLAQYDPGRPSARVGRRLRELYASTREAYIGRLNDVGIAHQNHRLRLIERAIEGAERSKDWSAVKALLELAAKEMGGTLTNVSKVEHQGAVEHRHLSVEDARSELAQRLATALDGGVLKALPPAANPLDNNDNPENFT